MSHIVVQENHIDNSKINYNIAENIVYFFSLVVKHPVYYYLLYYTKQ